MDPVSSELSNLVVCHLYDTLLVCSRAMHACGLIRQFGYDKVSGLTAINTSSICACCNTYVLQAAELAATCTSTKETSLLQHAHFNKANGSGWWKWYMWLQLLTVATMGKDATATRRNFTSDVGLQLQFYQESRYLLWVTVMWLALLCTSLACRNIILLFRLCSLYFLPAGV